VEEDARHEIHEKKLVDIESRRSFTAPKSKILFKLKQLFS
jgi:hypothetical protein